MLSSITPLGERGRRNRWSLTAAAYVGASALAGALGGAAMGAVGWALRHLASPPPAVDAGVLAVVGLAAVATDTWAGRNLPTVHRQVNEDWMQRYRGVVYGVGYGFQLGLGVVTIVTSATVYAAAALALLVATPGEAALVGLAFGSARALPLLAERRIRTPEALRRSQARLHRHGVLARRLAAAGTAAAGLAGVGALLAVALSGRGW